MTPSAAKRLLDVKRAEIQPPLTDLHQKYKGALSRLKEAEQSKGNLEAVLLLKKEKENFQSRTDLPKPSALPALDNLRKIYHRELESIEKIRKDAESIAFAHYRAALEKIIFDLTREGKVEEAIMVRDKLAKIEDTEPPVRAPEGAAEQIVVGGEENYTVTSILTLTKEDTLYVLTSDANANQAIYSKRSFETPFTIQVRAMTDGGNIRLYFGQHGIVIFNWEKNPKELRVHEPVGKGKHGIRDSKPLDPDRMYDFEIQVTESKIEIYVGKQKYGEVDGEFKDAEGTVGIGPAFGSTVSVARFAVTQLQSSL